MKMSPQDHCLKLMWNDANSIGQCGASWHSDGHQQGHEKASTLWNNLSNCPNDEISGVHEVWYSILFPFLGKKVTYKTLDAPFWGNSAHNHGLSLSGTTIPALPHQERISAQQGCVALAQTIAGWRQKQIKPGGSEILGLSPSPNCKT